MTNIAGRARPFASADTVSQSQRPLRIALFSGNYNYVRDGANRALNYLVGDLEQRGSVVRVYSPTTPTPAFDPRGTLVSVPSIGLPGRGEYRLGLGLPANIRADLHQFAPDLIHVSAPDWTGVAAQKLARSVGVPLIASLHTRFETYAGFYGAAPIRPTMERHLRRFYARNDRILVPTTAILEEFVHNGHGDAVRSWSRGVDRMQFDPARRDPAWRQSIGMADDACAVLFFGRLVREKGIVEYADIIDRLGATGTHICPIVIGDGPERGWLQRRLPSARILGHLNGTELGRAVASADIFVNPSVTEAFGNVTLEAMASGLPTISVDVASARALIDEAGGIFYCSGDIDEAAKAVLRLSMFPERRRSIGRRARQASAKYIWARASEMVWDVYQEALDQTATDHDR